MIFINFLIVFFYVVYIIGVVLLNSLYEFFFLYIFLGIDKLVVF